MVSKNFIYTSISLAILGCSALSYANNELAKPPTPASDENTLILNRGNHQQVIASNLNEANGNKSFQSNIKYPGITITENVRQQNNGQRIEENRVVVSISNNESVQLIQEFRPDGKKVTRSVIKQPASNRSSSLNPGSNGSQQGMLESKGQKNNLAINQVSTIEHGNQLTTTVIESDNFPFHSYLKKWMLIVSAGYGHYSDAIKTDGSTGIARLALNYSFYRMNGFDFGFEGGIQNGTNFRPTVLPEVLEALGGPSIQATIKPTFEFLPTISKPIPNYERVSAFAKLGLAFRTMTFDRDTIPNLSKTALDLHLGVAVNMSDYIQLLIDYQYIFGGSPNINSSMLPLPANNQGKAYNIPSEQGIMIGITYGF